jgi:hypothetical protein
LFRSSKAWTAVLFAPILRFAHTLGDLAGQLDDEAREIEKAGAAARWAGDPPDRITCLPGPAFSESRHVRGELAPAADAFELPVEIFVDLLRRLVGRPVFLGVLHILGSRLAMTDGRLAAVSSGRMGLNRNAG